MSNVITSPVSVPVSVPVSAPVVGQALATWSTKSGRVKTRHTGEGFARTALKVRLSQVNAQGLTPRQALVSALVGGDYSGFFRDVGQVLPAGFLKALRAHMALQVTDDMTVKQARAMLEMLPSKVAMVAVAGFLENPQKEVKGISAPCELPKSSAWLAEVAAEWSNHNQAGM